MPSSTADPRPNARPDPSAGPTADAAPAVDRRRLRSERGREQVVDALLALYDEGDAQPGAARIAERAGVSERSVFRYFADLDALAEEAVARQIARVRHLFAAPPAEGPLERRILALVDQRLAIHDGVATVSAAGHRIAPSAPSIAEAFAYRRELLREQVAVQFAPELAAAHGRDRTELLDALAAAAGFEQIDTLRITLGHSRAQTRSVTTRTLRALLTT